MRIGFLRLTALVAAAASFLPLYAPGTDGPPSLKFTFTERIREESSDNVGSLSESVQDSSAYVRFRTSLQAQWRPSSGWELTARLTNENRYYIAPKTDLRAGKNYDLHEIFFDYLYARWKSSGRHPLTLTLGRQDIMLGEGFVIFDGGPLDGSRSAYFNAARLDYGLGRADTLTFFYCDQPQTDIFLPLIHDSRQKMVEQRERGLGLYWSGAVRKTRLEGYLFRKNVLEISSAPGSGINVFGGRAQIPLSSAVSLTAEGALQSGSFGDLGRKAWGGYFHLDDATGLRLPWPSTVTLGGIFLSGDDPDTSDSYEGWDPAFSRWPKWSESLIYLFARESKPAFWTNFISLYGTLQFSLSENARLNATWHKLRAAEQTPPTALLSGEGKNRGNLTIVKVLYDVSKNLSGHFIWENFSPGDFYFSGARNFAWVRFEIMLKF